MDHDSQRAVGLDLGRTDRWREDSLWAMTAVGTYMSLVLTESRFLCPWVSLYTHLVVRWQVVEAVADSVRVPR